MIFIKDQTKNYRTSVLTVDRWSGTRRPMSWKYYFPCTNCAWPTATSRARIMGSLGWWLITLDFTAWRWPLSVIWPGPAASPYRYKYRKYRVFSHPPFRPPFFFFIPLPYPFFSTHFFVVSHYLSRFELTTRLRRWLRLRRKTTQRHTKKKKIIIINNNIYAALIYNVGCILLCSSFSCYFSSWWRRFAKCLAATRVCPRHWPPCVWTWENR